MTLPMLVHKYESILIQSWSGVYISEKYDGWRLVWNHINNTFTTRTGKSLQVPDYLYTEFESFQDIFSFDLDGEYWGGYGMFSKIDDQQPNIDDQMYFKIYDIIDTTMTFTQRHEILLQLREIINKNKNSLKHIEIIEHVYLPSHSFHSFHSSNLKCESVNDIIKRKMDEVVSKGGEGVVVRNPSGKYVIGTRSYDILKMKPVEFTELIIMGHHVTEKKLLIPNYVSSLICYTEEGDDLRITWGNRKQIAPPVYSIIRIKFSQLTPSGVPKFPSYIGIMSEHNLDPAQLEKFNRLKQLSTSISTTLLPSISTIQLNKCDEFLMPDYELKTCIVLVSSYYTTNYIKGNIKAGLESTEYVSTLLAYTINAIQTAIVVKSTCPPLIGQLLKISYKSLTKKGAPKNARIVEKIKNESLSPKELEKFDELRALEGISITFSQKRNTYSLTDQQIKLLQNNPKFVQLCTLQEALMKKIVIPAGKFALVQNGANVYKVCCAVKGNSIYCSCPSWIYQPLPPIKRTCKHCQAFQLKTF